MLLLQTPHKDLTLNFFQIQGFLKIFDCVRIVLDFTLEKTALTWYKCSQQPAPLFSLFVMHIHNVLFVGVIPRM